MNHVFISPVVGLLILLGPVVAWGQSAELIARLPETQRFDQGATLYLYHVGADELVARLDGTRALEALRTPDADAFLAELERLGRRGEARDALFRFVHESLTHETVVGGRWDVSPEQAAPARLLIIRPAAEKRPSFRATYDAALKAWSGDFSATEEDGLAIAHLRSTPPALRSAWHDDRVCWLVGEAREWLNRPRAERPLADAPAFRMAVEPLLAGRRDMPLALYYHDLRPAWRRRDATSAAEAWKRLSWRSLDSLSGATFVEGRLLRNRHYCRLGPDRYGLFRHTREARLNRDWLRRVPAEASGLTTGVWDATSFVGSFIGLQAVLFESAGMDAQADGMLEQAMGGLALLEPLVRTLGPRYLVYRVPQRYGAFPGSNSLPAHNAAVVLELRDPAAFDQALDALLAMTRGSISARNSNWGGVEVRQVNVFYATLHLAAVGSDLLVTTDAGVLKDAIEQWRRPGPSIVDTPEFRSIEPLILGDACFLMYFPPGGFARGIMDAWLPQANQLITMLQSLQYLYFPTPVGHAPKPAAQKTRGFDPFALPRGRALSAAVREPTFISAADDGVGVLFDGTAPLLCTPYYWSLLMPVAYGGLFNGETGDLLAFITQDVEPAAGAEP
jgi:hypothetical protein